MAAQVQVKVVIEIVEGSSVVADGSRSVKLSKRWGPAEDDPHFMGLLKGEKTMEEAFVASITEDVLRNVNMEPPVRGAISDLAVNVVKKFEREKKKAKEDGSAFDPFSGGMGHWRDF